MDGDRDLYAALLARHAPPKAHLAPLSVEPRLTAMDLELPNRDELVRIAIEHGYPNPVPDISPPGPAAP